MTELKNIEVDLDDPDAIELWKSLGELAKRLPGDWLLIGGLMVQLHAVEHGVTQVRPSEAIDILGQERPPGTLEAIHAALTALDVKLQGPDLEGFARRYVNDEGRKIDVLSPEGLGAHAKIGGVKAIGVPGGTQALARETVQVTVEGSSFELRRPTLLGCDLD